LITAATCASANFCATSVPIFDPSSSSPASEDDGLAADLHLFALAWSMARRTRSRRPCPRDRSGERVRDAERRSPSRRRPVRAWAAARRGKDARGDEKLRVHGGSLRIAKPRLYGPSGRVDRSGTDGAGRAERWRSGCGAGRAERDWPQPD
jgi:hypothetical protein